jgi:NADPH-dependent curcumin reductase CurA
MNTRQIILQSRPLGHHTALKLKNTIRGDAVWEVLLKGLYYSVDPYMRGRMNDAKSYVAL